MHHILSKMWSFSNDSAIGKTKKTIKCPLVLEHYHILEAVNSEGNQCKYEANSLVLCGNSMFYY